MKISVLGISVTMRYDVSIPLKFKSGGYVQDMKGKKDTELVGLVPGALETMMIKKEVLESGTATGRELTVTMDGFGKRWLVVACEPLRNKAGQTLGVITACMDVTEQVCFSCQ